MVEEALRVSRVREVSPELWDALVMCARGKREPDLVVQGGTVLNVYSGELMEANVWVVGERIAYVGPRVYEGSAANVIDASGQIVVPGYIEPHAHPFQLYNPHRYAECVLARGTTCSVNDDLIFYMNLEFGQVGRMFEKFASLPIKMLWSVRLDPQAHLPQKKQKFNSVQLSRLMKNPYVVQAGEVTDWYGMINGDEEMRDAVLAAKGLRRKVEGHCAGASWDTLAVLAAAGVTADHEAITAEEALRRIRLGYWTTLRHSSLRPDLPELLKGLLGEVKQWNRVMMTTDGPTPEFLRNGYTDYLLRTAMECGLDPIVAYQLVTINPATYYGLDDELGGIGPGRLADLLLLKDLREPTPQLVIADGRVVARDARLTEGLPTPNWSEFGLMPLQPRGAVDPEWFDVHTEQKTIPALVMENPAITRRLDLPVTTAGGRVIGLVEESEDLCYIAFLNRSWRWVCNGVIKGFADASFGALASSFTCGGEYVVIGRDQRAMAAATQRMLDIGGGIVVMSPEREVLFELPLRVGGGLGEQSVEELSEAVHRLSSVLRAHGHRFYDPVYTMLFLSSTHLPELRLSSEGLFEVKTRKVLHPVREL
jgi:adenine deaminase